MFRKLRFQFIAITTLAITLILMTLVGVINTVRYLQTEHDIQAVLDLLTENNGTIPDTNENRQTFDRQFVSQGTLYNFNYFSARIKAKALWISRAYNPSVIEVTWKKMGATSPIELAPSPRRNA